MNHNDFKSLLKKSSIKILVIGVFIFLMGAPILGANFYDESKVAYWIIGSLFSGLGLFMIIKSVKELTQIKSDSHPILKAIVNQDKNFLIWVYQKQIISKVEGANVGKSNNIIFVTKENKLIEITLNNKTSPDAVIGYVISQFPEVLVGFTDDNALKVKSMFGK